jgi:hypothetical protein
MESRHPNVEKFVVQIEHPGNLTVKKSSFPRFEHQALSIQLHDPPVKVAVAGESG